MNSIPRFTRGIPRRNADVAPRTPANDRQSCVTIMEIGEEEAIEWDAIVALRKAA